jgi:hypothetical protein
VSDYERKKKQAAITVAALDRLDGYKDRELRMIAIALECGLKYPKSNCQYEALIMLEDLLQPTKETT